MSIDAFMAAIQAQESSGRAQVTNRSSGAHGLFQIMPANWAPWSREAFGRVVAKTPSNQRAVARHKMGQYYNRYGSWDLVAAAWFGGPGAANALANGNRSVLSRSDGNLTIGQYIAKMRRGMANTGPGSTAPNRGATGRIDQSLPGLADPPDDIPDDDPFDPDAVMFMQTMQAMSNAMAGGAGSRPWVPTHLTEFDRSNYDDELELVDADSMQFLPEDWRTPDDEPMFGPGEDLDAALAALGDIGASAADYFGRQLVARGADAARFAGRYGPGGGLTPAQRAEIADIGAQRFAGRYGDRGPDPRSGRRLRTPTSSVGNLGRIGPASSKPIPGGLQSNARRGARLARALGHSGTIHGIGSRPGPSDHPHGNAIDLMLPNTRAGHRKGWTMANYYLQNRRKLGVKYIIYNGKIASARKVDRNGQWVWRPYRHYSGVSNPTLDHDDHIHLSFYGNAHAAKVANRGGRRQAGSVRRV